MSDTEKKIKKEDQSVIKSCTDTAIKCARCKALLAFVDAKTKCEIRIKYRDLYIRILEPVKFEITCRACGHFNLLEKID